LVIPEGKLARFVSATDTPSEFPHQLAVKVVGDSGSEVAAPQCGSTRRRHYNICSPAQELSKGGRGRKRLAGVDLDQSGRPAGRHSAKARCARRRHQLGREIEARFAMHGAQLLQKLIDVVLVEHGPQRHLIHDVSSRHVS
jgi:hypothetical protein